MQQIVWLAASAISVMAILVFAIWQRRRKRWHPVDLPLAQLSKRIGKADKSLARDDSEGQLAWLERLAMAVDDNDTSSQNSAKINKTNKLTANDQPENFQAKIIQIQQAYRQLRYGRLSTLATSDSEYRTVLKQLKKDANELF